MVIGNNQLCIQILLTLNKEVRQVHNTMVHNMFITNLEIQHSELI